MPNDESIEMKTSFDRTQDYMTSFYGFAADVDTISKLPTALKIQIDDVSVHLIDHMDLLDDSGYIVQTMAVVHSGLQTAGKELGRFNSIARFQISQYIEATSSLYKQSTIIINEDAKRWPIITAIDLLSYKVWPTYWLNTPLAVFYQTYISSISERISTIEELGPRVTMLLGVLHTVNRASRSCCEGSTDTRHVCKPTVRQPRPPTDGTGGQI